MAGYGVMHGISGTIVSFAKPSHKSDHDTKALQAQPSSTCHVVGEEISTIL